jgi:hypothetical protein
MTLLSILAAIVGSIAFEWRTGLTALALVPIMVLFQTIQHKNNVGFSESTGKCYEESSQIIKEKLVNIRTTLSLGSNRIIEEGYEKKLTEVSK